MKLSKVLYHGEYVAEADPDEIEFTHIVTHTADLSSGVLFVCLRGIRYDSHTLVKIIETGGAAAVIAEESAYLPSDVSIPVFRVPNTRRTLSFLFSRYYGDPQRELCMIGVTGTNGKTSTATVLYSILRALGYKCALIGTAECLYNDKIYTLPETCSAHDRLRTMTTPDPDILFPMLRMMKDEEITHVVMEVSSHALALDKVAPIAFELGLFTNLSPEHMDFHSDMKSYMLAKAKLFSLCKTGIFNCDSDYAEDLIAAATCRALRVGVVWKGDFRATDIELRGASGVSYSFIAPGVRLRVRTTLPGTFSVYNTLLALTAATELGASPIAAADALAAPIRIPGRMERIPTGDVGFSVFIDYAHTEYALKSLLTTIRSFRKSGERIVLVFGCGGDRDREKRAPMGRTAEELADFTIVTSDNPRSEDPDAIITEILSGMSCEERHVVIRNRRRAIEHAILTAMPGDIIILAGKGHETYEILASGVRQFDERKILSAALEKRKKGDTVNEI